jgi:hypothetical protein
MLEGIRATLLAGRSHRTGFMNLVRITAQKPVGKLARQPSPLDSEDKTSNF